MYVVGICGQTCAGKGKMVKGILDNVEGVTVIHQDSYYFTGNENTNYDIPSAIDFSLLISHIKCLLKGEAVEAPVYCFKTHSRLNESVNIKPCKILVIEGILIFSQKELLDLINLKVYISTYPELAFSRRLKRDVEERGRTISEVTERYFKDVLPSTKKYVEPSENFADIIIPNNSNTFIGLDLLIGHLKNLGSF